MQSIFTFPFPFNKKLYFFSKSPPSLWHIISFNSLKLPLFFCACSSLKLPNKTKNKRIFLKPTLPKTIAIVFSGLKMFFLNFIGLHENSLFLLYAMFLMIYKKVRLVKYLHTLKDKSKDL